ncbi:MAG: hypothetical protein IPJ65_39185 [Archangiaceae bacterium]|nr:hypothetical protein [Archangiaceae bacterium]
MLRKASWALLSLVAVTLLALVGWYQIDGQPRPEAARFTARAGIAFHEADDGSLSFTPSTPNGHGLLIMPGALIKPLSYARTAAFFADRGYTVFLPAAPMRLSILGVDGAAARLAGFAVKDWFVIGHSMGGLAGLELVRRHAPVVRAVALWAAAMPRDFSDLEVPVLFLWGDRDGLLPREKLDEARSKLPSTTRYTTFPGGNHRDFALYTHQFFDAAGTLGWEQQTARANEETEAFFSGR